MKKKCEVTFLGSGEVTWETPSGRFRSRRYVKKGTKMTLMVEKHFSGEWEMWDGGWSIIMPVENVKITPVPQKKRVA